jgi:hypothetical protein
MKFQNKIFYKFIFPLEFPYALWAIGEFGRAATCTNLSTRKSIHIFVISRPNYIGPDKKIE